MLIRIGWACSHLDPSPLGLEQNFLSAITLIKSSKEEKTNYERWAFQISKISQLLGKYISESTCGLIFNNVITDH